MKQKILFLAAVVVCLSLLSYGTLAFYTAEDTAHNVITTGGVAIEIQEWADENQTPFPENGVTNVMPGKEVTKIVEVKNTGAAEAWVRVKVEKNIELDDNINGEIDLNLVTLNADTEKWALSDDGYYYYTERLAPGEVSEPLFTSVSFDAKMGNLYQNSKAIVDVKAYAVQTANNGATVWDAELWPEA